MRPKGSSKKSDRKYFLAIGIILVILAFGIVAYQSRSYSQTLEFNGITEINQAVPVGNNVIAFAGTQGNGNLTRGVAGLIFLSNGSYTLFNVSDYFLHGAIYSISYNGSAYLLGGTRYGVVDNTSVLIPTLVLYDNGRVVNLSRDIPNFYIPGQILATSWADGYWLVGGTALTVMDGRTYQVPFLLKVKNNLTDLTPYLPSYFLSPISVGTGIYTLSSNGSYTLVGGSHLFNFTMAIYNGSKFLIITPSLGSVLTSAPIPGGWIFGGFNYSLNDTEITLTLLGVIQGSHVDEYKLKYQVGVITAVSYYTGVYAVALRIPTVNNLTGVVSEEGIILTGRSPSSLVTVYVGENESINSLLFTGNHLIGVGYKATPEGKEGLLIILSE